MGGSSILMGSICNFFSPGKIILGFGAARQVGVEARLLGRNRALVVTRPGRAKAGWVAGIEESLIDAKIQVGVFDKVELSTPARVIDECAKFAREGGYDLIVGLGGGSTLDTAKGAAMMAVNKGKVLDYVGVDVVPNKGLPLILLPTTWSGSEVSPGSGITDETDNTIRGVGDTSADVVIADPLFTISSPSAVIADTGIDALVQCIEPYVSVRATPFSDILAIEAVRLISENLPLTFAKGDNKEARFNMSLASILAGLAFSSGGLGAVHGLAFVLQTEFHLGHGRACSILLPYVMEYNMMGNFAKYGQIAKAMGEKIEGLSDYTAAEKSVSAVKRLLEMVNISIRLTDYGISRDELPKLIKGAMKYTKSLAANPRDLNEEDVKGIFLKALE